MTEEEFKQELLKINIIPTKEQLNLLDKYYHILIEWNNMMNLTAITEKKQVYLKHFYDSLTITKVINLNSHKKLLDFGTGAGFPGVVLKIFFPDLEIILIDALEKRVKFLNHVIEELNLKKIIAIHERVENISNQNFDIITTRAVANLPTLIKYIHKLLTPSTLFVPLKASVDQELKNANVLLKKYHLKLIKRETFYLPYENSLRNILIIKKTN